MTTLTLMNCIQNDTGHNIVVIVIDLVLSVLVKQYDHFEKILF
jgi:hypothetical protein